MTRREFLHVLAVAAAGGLPLGAPRAEAGAFYDRPRFGNAHFLHFTD